jgi:hypothetical protein
MARLIREPTDVLYRIKRGLSAYVSYLAACEMNEAFSEYVLYEPILRIFAARRFKVTCEYECPGIEHADVGDRKRLDFHAEGHDVELALEVKWAKTDKPRLGRDIAKLKAFHEDRPQAAALLCVFGRKTVLQNVKVDGQFRERGNAVYADLGKTKYGCRIFELGKSPSRPHRSR